LKKADLELLVFDSDQVLSRSEKMGDLFAPVLKLRQKLPAIEELRSISATGNVRRGANLRAASKKRAPQRAPADKRPNAVSEQLIHPGPDVPIAPGSRPTSKGSKSAKPQRDPITKHRHA
jgi:hypothetical protein